MHVTAKTGQFVEQKPRQHCITFATDAPPRVCDAQHMPAELQAPPKSWLLAGCCHSACIRYILCIVCTCFGMYVYSGCYSVL